MMKIVASLLLFLSVQSFAQVEGVKILDLPLGSAASTAANDAFPYVDTVYNVTRRIKMSDLINLPAFSSQIIPISRGGTGQVTANAALNALLPSQIGSTGYCLKTNGTTTSWSACVSGGGTVTSVGLALPDIFTVSNSPVTTNGTLTASLNDQLPNTMFSGPVSITGPPTFRALVSADIPTLTSSKISDFTTAASAAAPVQSVFSRTGSVTAQSGDYSSFYVPLARTISTTAPITGGGDLSANRTISIPVATSSVNGYLSSTDWSTFNGKQSSGNYITALTGDVSASGPGSAASTLATVNSNVGSFTYGSFTVNGKGLITAASSGATPEVPLTFSTGLTRSTNTVTVNTSQNIATLSNLTSNGFVKTSGGVGTLSVDTTSYVPTTRTISTTAPITGGGDLSANRTFAIPASTNSVDGYLTAADHTTFAAKESALTFSSPLSRSVNTISIPASTNSVNGYLTSADHTTFAAKVNRSGDTMTGSLSLPDLHLYQSTNDLHFYYDTGPGIFTIDSPQSMKLNSTSASLLLMSGTDVQMVNTGNGSSIELSSSVVTQTVGGAQIIADGGGGLFLTSASSQPIQFQSNLGIESHFTNSADYSIINDTFNGDVMRAYGSGDLTFHTFNLSNLTFNSDLDTLFTTNTAGGRLITSQQITLRDPINNPSADQIIIKALDGSNFFMGLNNFNSANPGDQGHLVIGVDSLQISAGGSNNLVVGNASLTGLGGSGVSGSENVAIGKNVLYLNTSGSGNFGAGTAALFNNSIGNNNFALGSNALQNNIDQSNSVAIGADAGKLSNAANALYIGTSAGQANINGDSVVYIGGGAGSRMTGSANIAIGSGAMVGDVGATGDSNISIGLNSTDNITTGRFNTVISSGDGATGAGAIITSGSHNIVIGYNADVPNGTNSGQLSLGNFIYGGGLTSEGTTIATGQIGFGVKVPTAVLQLRAGTASANAAPLKFTSGVASQTTKEAGAVNYDGTDLTLSDSSTVYTLDKVLKGSATLDFASTAAGASSDLTITVTGAALSDVVSLGVPNGATLANGVFTAWVSAANTVKVRFTNTNLVTALDPASGTFKVTVSK